MAQQTEHTGPTHGTILNVLLEQHNISHPEFRRIYCQHAGCALNTASNLLQHRKERFDRATICLLCALFGFEPRQFGLPDDAFTTGYSSRPQDMVFSNESTAEGGNDQGRYIQQFFWAIKAHLLRTERTLHVCDYVAARQGIQQKTLLDDYLKEDRDYFQRLEERLLHHPFEYHRIIQLPLGAKVRTWEQAFEMVAEVLLPDTFAHLCRCLRDFPTQSHFRVVMYPFRLYTYYLVDQEVILTEYPRFDRSGVPIPDLLFVNHRNLSNPEAVGSRYIRSCLQEFKRMSESPANHDGRLMPMSLLLALRRLNVNLKQALEHLKSFAAEDAKRLARLGALGPVNNSANWGSQENSFKIQQEVEERARQISDLQDRLRQLDEKFAIWRELYPQTDDKA